MVERTKNLCAEAGCPALCCRDMIFWDLDIPYLDTFRQVAEVKKLGPHESPLSKPDGIYFAPNSDGVTCRLTIKGPCPHLTEDLRCSICGQLERPIECSNFEFASDECMDTRKQNEVVSPVIPLNQIK